MARILYALAGEGLGHAFRSKAIIDELKKKHQIWIVTGNRPYYVLSKQYKNVHRVGTYKIIYRNNAVANISTFLLFIITFPFHFIYNLKIISIIKKNNIDMIITDFEPFSCYFASLFNIPCISIDNQHTLVNCKIEPATDRFTSFIGKLIINIFVPFADYFICTTFFYLPIKKRNTALFGPVLRKEVLSLKPKKGDYILVYQTSTSNRKLFEILQQLPERFIAYGFNIDKQEKNIIYRKTDTNSFLTDLANCKAVITNGGFTLIGEALHLHKPLLCIPVKRQFEQIQNAYYIKKLRYGNSITEPSLHDIRFFLKKLGKYEKNLKKYTKKDNSSIIKKIEWLVVKSSS